MANLKDISEKLEMLEKEISNTPPIPYKAHEKMRAAFESTIKKLFITIIICIGMILISNMAWLAYESQFETTFYEVSTDGGGDASYNSGEGDIINDGLCKSET